MQPSKTAALVALALCLPVWSAQPAIGDRAPDFTLSTLNGKSIRLSEQTARGPVVLVVLRGFPGYQCPVCNRQVQEFLKSAPEFAEAGAQVLMVYPGPPADLQARAGEFLKDKTFPKNFDLLLDPGYQFTNLYGLRWDAPKETAYPATFLIDRKGEIFFAKISNSHGGRTTPNELLGVIRTRR